MKEEISYLCSLCPKCAYKSIIIAGKCPYSNEVRKDKNTCDAYKPTQYWAKKDRIEANAARLTSALERGQLPRFVIGQKVYVIEYPKQIVEAEIVYIHIETSGRAQYQIKSYDPVSGKITTKQNYLHEKHVYATQQECWEALAEMVKNDIISQLTCLKYQAERNGVALPSGSVICLPEKI